MPVNYDLTADQVLRILGYNKPSGDTMINQFEREYNIKMPASLSSFLRIAYECPMLSTCDCDLMIFKGNISCYILLLKSPLTLENTKFVAGELSLIVSLVLYLSTRHYEP